MKALTVAPGRGNSLALEERRAPEPGAGELLVRGVALGVCGTDREIAGGQYGWAPAGADRLVIGHESLGRVVTAPPDSGIVGGDLVVGVVRRPDPEPCGACSVGQFDMCRNGRYRERGIKELDGYGSELWTLEATYAVPVAATLGLCGVLVEPTSVVAKAWEQVDRIGHRAWYDPQTVLVTGAGPIGLLAALLAVQRGLQVHVLDRVTDGVKPQLVRDLGATYHVGSVAELASGLHPDVVIEATGVGRLVLEALTATGPYGIVCLTGVSPAGRRLTVDAGAVNREVVLENDAVVGSVNANTDHYRQASQALADADPSWLRRLVTRVVPLDHPEEAFARVEDQVKTVVALDPADAVLAADRRGTTDG